ncbi:MAG: rod shape-determining protein MreC [Actinomycetota bacterium]
MYRKSTKQRVALAALLAATATVVTLDFRSNRGGPIRRAQDVAVSVVAPLQDGIGRLFRPVGEFLSGLASIGGLRSEITLLENENDRLKAQQREFPGVLLENERLQALIEQKPWTQGKTIAARVIGVGPSNQEWTVFLDKGRADGLREDMAVVSAEGLVGRVTLALRHQAKVLMVIDPEHAVGSKLTGSGETGVLGGKGEDDMKFEFIDPDAPVKIGETVITSGYDKGIYPANIPIGRITRVQSSRDGLSKIAHVRSFVDFSRLDTVLVLLDSGPVSKR